MSYSDDLYGEAWARDRNRKDILFKMIIEEFEDLSLEEKVNKLIEIYAREQAYK